MKKYSVEFKYIESDGTEREGEMYVPLSRARSLVKEQVVREGDTVVKVDHVREGPWGQLSGPVTVELEDDEVANLRALRNGSLHWRFTVTEAGGRAAKGDK